MTRNLVPENMESSDALRKELSSGHAEVPHWAEFLEVKFRPFTYGTTPGVGESIRNRYLSKRIDLVYLISSPMDPVWLRML